LSCNFAARDAELDQLKMLVQQLADKVNAPGDTPADRLAAVENRVDEVALHGVRLGTTLGPLQGFPPIATNPLGNTTISVAIGGYYCTETVIWLQFVCLLQQKI
jgi:hypothetical protein